MGDWYIGEYFSYIRIWGSNNVHLLPIIVPNKMVLEEISFQKIIYGVIPKLSGAKRKGLPKFPLILGTPVIQNSTHAGILGKKIITLKLGEAPRRMHDTKSFLASHFTQEHMKTSYAHQMDHDDSIYQGANAFSKVVRRISSHYEKNFIFQYQDDVKNKVIHYRKLLLELEEKT